MAYEPSAVSQRRKAVDIVTKQRRPQWQLRLLQRSPIGDWVWTVKKKWDAEEIDEVVLLAGLRKAWEEAERAARVRRAQRTEQSLQESWQRAEEEER